MTGFSLIHTFRKQLFSLYNITFLFCIIPVQLLHKTYSPLLLKVDHIDIVYLTHDSRLLTLLSDDILHQELRHLHLRAQLHWFTAPLQQQLSCGLGN